MKAFKKICLLIIPLIYLSSCYVRVDDGHRQWHHHDHDDHHEVIIEKR